MFNALLKKRKSNKGFTLIELIVVIAIIAILSLLLVPRFLGFTESAKVSADKAACATIEKGVMTLLATGEIVYSKTTPLTNTIQLDSTGATIGATITLATGVTGTVKDKVQALVGDSVVPQQAGKTNFIANISTGGAITVTVN